MKSEKLDPKLREFVRALSTDLRPYVCTINGIDWAHGPLIITHLAGFEPEKLNTLFEDKKRLADEFLANIRFDPHSYLFLIERPYRLEALLTIREKISDAQYWRCLADVWQDAEYVQRNKKVWISLFTSPRRYRPLLANRRDRHYLKTLPATLTIYRGYQQGKYNHKLGLSWTLSKEKAIWFACRRPENGKPIVVKGQCKKEDVICYTNGRKEEEIIINPRKVTKIKTIGTLPELQRNPFNLGATTEGNIQ